jgi:hypothetical protein
MSGDASVRSEACRGADGFSADVARIRAQFGKGVPSYFVLLGHVQAMLDEPDSLLGRGLSRVWASRTFYVAYDRPLLLLAALRADALAEGPPHPLYRAIATDPPEPEAATGEAVRQGLAPERTRVFRTLATRFVQTNETLRSVAWRWPAYIAGCEGGARTLALVDLGASAGLNLVAERLPATWIDPSGAALPAATTVRAVARLGLDARPVDLTADNVTWMRACIWPGDRGRGQRLEQALAAFAEARQSGEGPTLEACDVSGFASRVARVAEEHPNAFVLAYQSYLRDYLPPAARQAHLEAMQACLAGLAPGRAIWVELEVAATESRDPEPAAITVHVRGREGQIRTLEIARTLHHPIEVRPLPSSVRELEHALYR